MKNLLLSFIFLAATTADCKLYAQAPSIEWQKSLGGSYSDRGHSIQQTSDAGFIVAGFSYSNNGDVSGNHGTIYGNSFDYWIVKLDATGNLIWQKSLGGTDADGASSIQQTTDGGFIVAGYSWSNDGDAAGNHGHSDNWIVKLDMDGNLVWQTSLGGIDNELGRSIRQTIDGGYIVGGYSSSNEGDVSGNHGGIDYWIAKLDSEGNLLWQKCLGGTADDYANSTQQSDDGGFIVAGHSYSNDDDVTGHHGCTYFPCSDYWIVKLDSSGNLAWEKSLGGSDYEEAFSAQQTSDGGFIVAGYTKSNDGDVSGWHVGYKMGSPTTDYWIVKLNSVGNIIWQKSLGGSGDDEAYSVQQTTDGGFIIAGFSDSNDGDVSGNHGSYDYWIVKLDMNGNILWQTSLGGSFGETADYIQQTTDSGFIIAGSSGSIDNDVSGNHGDVDYWIVKLSSDLLIGMTPISNNFISLYPNPASTQLHFRFANGQTGELTVLNIFGEQAMRREVSLASKNITLDISGLPAGTYIVHLSTPKEISTAKFVKE